MGERLLDRADCLYRHFVVEKLSAEAFGGSGLQQRVGVVFLKSGVCFGVGIYNYVMLGQRKGKCRKVGQAVAVNQYAVERVAYADATCFALLMMAAPLAASPLLSK